MIPFDREFVKDVAGAVFTLAMYCVFVFGGIVLAAELIAPNSSEIPSYPAPESIPARRCTCECEEVP